MEENNNVLKIEARRIPELLKKLNTINRKIEKLGGNLPKAEIAIGEEYTEKKYMGMVYSPMSPNADFDGMAPWYLDVPFVDVEIVAAETVKIDGWEFLGRIEHHDDGKRISIYDPSNSMPKEVQNLTAAKCDHCERKSHRLNTYIIRNLESGEIKQLGSSCITKYTGINPEIALRWFAYCGDFSIPSEDEDGNPYGIRCRDDVLKMRFLGFVAAAVREIGWVSRTSARNLEERGVYNTQATADVALYEYYNIKTTLQVTEEDMARVNAAIEWLKTEVAPKESKSNYEFNLVSSCVDAYYISAKETGIAASLIVAHANALEREINRKLKAKENAEKPNQYLGEVGERKSFEGVVVFNQEYEGNFGPYHLIRIETENGLVVWFGTGYTAADMTVGNRFRFDARIKKLDSYKERKQTVVTRVTKVEDLGKVEGE